MELHDHAVTDGLSPLVDAYGDVPLGVECAWTPGAAIEREMSDHEHDADPSKKHS